MTFRMKIMDNTSAEKRLISAQDSASGRAAWRARVSEGRSGQREVWMWIRGTKRSGPLLHILVPVRTVYSLTIFPTRLCLCFCFFCHRH